MGNEQSTQKKRQKTNAEKKVQNGEMNGHAVPTPEVTEPVASKEAVVEKKSETPPVVIKNEPKPPVKEEVDSSKPNGPAHVETTPEQKTTVVKDAEPPKKAPKPSEDEVTNFFGKMFKKKSEPVKPASESKDSVDAVQVTAVDLKIDVQPDPVDIKTSTEPEPEPEGEALEPSPVEVTEENNPPEDIKTAEKSVMNFFKTFVTPTKTSKEAKATPDASKEQSQKEAPPAPSTNVQEAPKAPPPPPPAPPKMESKAEPAVKKEETSATKAAAAAATKAEGSAKTKTKDSSFSKLFRPKVDASKSSTLEAAAKPEEPPAPKPEEKNKRKNRLLECSNPRHQSPRRRRQLHLLWQKPLQP
ncbi:neurofilament heavy polypeptide-like isoform X3 [Megalobrama amblycephala]|uniref:neurofilament heavy polypeptide-like isoform X3 n=1 Tax=Megalobrama amblycephala TaxID=75352 RepID=UPI0020142476|nr:neurofilament heavy polypeptide-like isoform X3 [Megalobrama amblycephala]